MKPTSPVSELIPRARVGKLDSVVAWRREIGKVYRAMRRGDMHADLGAKLTYVANVAATLVKIEEELRHAGRIADELARQNNGAFTNGQSHTAIEYAPAEQLPDAGEASK